LLLRACHRWCMNARSRSTSSSSFLAISFPADSIPNRIFRLRTDNRTVTFREVGFCTAQTDIITTYFIFPNDWMFMYGISTFCLHQHPLEYALEELSCRTGFVEIMDDGPHYVASTESLTPFHSSMHSTHLTTASTLRASSSLSGERVSRSSQTVSTLPGS